MTMTTTISSYNGKVFARSPLLADGDVIGIGHFRHGEFFAGPNCKLLESLLPSASERNELWEQIANANNQEIQ